MDKRIGSLGEAAVFFTFHANSGYWQDETDEKDRKKTAFTSHQKLCRFIHMLFGHKKAPGIFQRTTEVLLAAVNW